ncbi:MAG: DUF362 domain-containing protein [Planctomycetes bacterium]|nr:DUF362 domain-containing protein [Planctomycetota bacterium]
MRISIRRILRASALAGAIIALAVFGARPGSGTSGGDSESIVGISTIPYGGAATTADECAFYKALTDDRIRAAIEEALARALGPDGLRARIGPGDKVVVKTNIVEADLREGVVTDPRVCRAVCRLALDATGSAGSVTVVDACFGKGLTAFQQAGYDDDGDGRLDGLPDVKLNDLDGYRTSTSLLVTYLSPQLYWGQLYLPDILRTREQAQAGPSSRRETFADVVISVPNFKNHYNAGMTCALKNRIGCASLGVYSDRSKMHYTSTGGDSLNEAIVDLNRMRPDDVAVLDGLTANIKGPNHRSVPVAQRHNYVFHPFFFLASDDSVALDAVATHIAGYRTSTISYLDMAQVRGLGTHETGRIRVAGPTVDEIRAELLRRYATARNGVTLYPFPDRYGNVNTARRRTDVDPPAVAEVVDPADGSIVPLGPVEVRFHAEDAGATGIARVEVIVDGAYAGSVACDGKSAVDGAWTWDAAVAGAGEHTIRIVAFDDEYSSLAGPEIRIRAARRFIRGEINGDGRFDLADAIAILSYIFASGPEPGCLEAADAGGDGLIDIGDAIRILETIFAGADPLPAPYPACGYAPVPSDLGCAASACGP